MRPFLLQLLVGVALAGCPTADPWDDDFSGDDDASGDDDSADDDDTGDDDTGSPPGSGTVTVSGAPACTPVYSSIWIDNVDGDSSLRGIQTSSEALTCNAYRGWDDALAQAWGVFQPSYDAALKVRDPVAACAATRTYYLTIQGIEDGLWPPGSCALQLYFDGYVPGFYEVGGGLGSAMSGQLLYPSASYYGAMVDSLGDCNGYSDWDSEWAPAQDAAVDAGEATRVRWSITAGEATLQDDNGGLRVEGAELTLAEDGGSGTGMLAFELNAVHCGL